jgi:hypothetical protein
MVAVLHLLGNDIDTNLIVVERSRRHEHGATAQNFGAFQNRPMPAKQNQSTPLGIKIDT